jgi:uncharacterized protein
MDLDGFYPEKLHFAWDTTSKKDEETVRRQMLVMNEVGSKHWVNAGKDMSNPGSIGTLGMLLETSGKGGNVDLDRVPCPEGVNFAQWLKSYQGCGFVLSVAPKNSLNVLGKFKEVGVEGAVVGKVNDSSRLTLSHDQESLILFDFEKDIITGCKPSRLPEGYAYFKEK